MRIDELSNPVTHQYAYEERSDSDMGKTGQFKPLKNPPVVQNMTNELLVQKKLFPENNNVLVALSMRDPVSSMQMSTVFYKPYDFGRNIYQAVYQKVEKAYTSKNSNDYKGLYVDTLV